MCGLCGWFTSDNVQLNKGRRLQRARAMEGLLIANQVRGTDSTGVAAIDFEGQHDILKVAEEPWDFVKRKATQSILRRDSPIMIGHTRMTSMGNDVTDDNAHPFNEGKVIGAHNGVINNYLELDKTVRVDSQAVFRMLSDYPDSYEWVFQQISGSCALTWYDVRDKTGLYIVAHSNPLAAAIIPSIETVFWSSQADHLEPIMRAVYGGDVQFMDIKRDTVYRLDASDVWSWQEMKVTFRGYSYSSRGTYKYNGETFSYGGESEDEFWQDYYGVSARDMGFGTDDGKDEGEGKSSTLNLPATVAEDDQDRYEDYWDRLMGMEESGLASDSDDDSDDNRSESVEPRRSLHDLTEDQYQQLNADLDNEDDGVFFNERFPVDMVEDIDCGYCDKPCGKGAVWDSGLELMLCKPCQNWWDNYGSGLPGNYPEATA